MTVTASTGDVQAMATVYANPKQIDDPAAPRRQLAPMLGVPETELIAKLNSDFGSATWPAR